MKKKNVIEKRLAHVQSLYNAEVVDDEPDISLLRTLGDEIEVLTWVLK